jgi:serine/threonine-protein kinase RsbW
MTVSEISMVVPAESRFVSTLRVTAASLAAELDFSIDEVEELQMGANELVVLLSELAQDHNVDTLSLTYLVGEDSIELRGNVAAETGDVSLLDDISRQILDAVVDEYSFTGNTAQLIKRRVAR